MTATLHTLPFRVPRPEVWTLRRAVDLCVTGYWRDMRRLANARSHCKLLTEALGGDTLLEAVTYGDLLTYAEHRKALRLEPATVFANLAVVPVLYAQAKLHGYSGPVPVVPTVTVPKKLKWWLNPEQELEALAWCDANDKDLGDYIRWAKETGLRVEETLRVTPTHCTGAENLPRLMVPGTKTAGSQCTLPISLEASELILRRTAGGSPKLFGMPYRELWSRWERMRLALRWPRGRTLKAIRRTFARNLAAKGAPLPVVQQLLRHSSPATTMEYLRLTGGAFNDEEVRRWL